jgi:cation transport regulator ChaB
MPTRKEDLPSTIKRSPERVQRTYAKALDNAHEQYRGDEERAHRTAYAAVKHIAEKRGDHWELKNGAGPSDPQAAKGPPASRRRPSETRGGIDEGKPKSELYEDAKRAGIEGRSNMSKRELAQALQKHSERETARARAS